MPRQVTTMINFFKYKELTLKDISRYERARKGRLYPKGSILIQLSASDGETDILAKVGQAELKYAVVMPKKDINSEYLLAVIRKNMDIFLSRYKLGMNIRLEDIGKIEIQLHDRETQDAVADYMKLIEEQENIIVNEIEMLQKSKETFLDKLFVEVQK